MAESKYLFPLGKCVATPVALALLAQHQRTPAEYLARHHRCDWGDVCQEDQEANDEALQSGGRLMSVYKLNENDRIWIITEADRSSTCVLTPSCY